MASAMPIKNFESISGQIAKILAGRIIRGELEPEQATSEYMDTLRAFFGEETKGSPPHFDLVLLGMGRDGHTASLFPGAAVIHEETRWVVTYSVRKLDTWRVTLAPAVINAAAHVTFLVSGAAKAGRLREVLEGPYRPHALPAQIVRPIDGRLLWLVDEAAAADLEEGSPFSGQVGRTF